MVRVLIHTNGNPLKKSGGYAISIRKIYKMFYQQPNTEVFGLLTCFGSSGGKPIYLRDCKHKNRHEPANLSSSDQRLLESIKFFLHDEVFNDIDVINKIIDEYKIDVFFTLCDVLIFSNKNKNFIHCYSCSWFPCHYDPIDNRSIKALSMFDMIFSLCPTVCSKLLKIFPKKDIVFCPHVVELKNIKETTNSSRKKFNIPINNFVWFCNAKHYEQSNRKSYDDIMLAFKDFLEIHPNSFLYINNANTRKVKCPIDYEIPLVYPPGTIINVKYCEKTIQVPYNPQYQPGKKYSALIEITIKESPPMVYDLQELATVLGLPPNKYHINEMEKTDEELILLYQCCDVLVAATKSEGFGLPSLEAQILGTPVITTKFLAMKDYTFFGISVPPVQKLYQPLQTAFWVQPDIKGIVKAAETIKNWTYEERMTKQIMARSIISCLMSYENVKKIILSTIKNYMKNNKRKKIVKNKSVIKKPKEDIPITIDITKN
jgi:glycosyltransferase involved in cell wall biosynthesis